jgi:hypothetical protein
MTADAPVIQVFYPQENIYIVPPADVDALVHADHDLKE